MKRNLLEESMNDSDLGMLEEQETGRRLTWLVREPRLSLPESWPGPNGQRRQTVCQGSPPHQSGRLRLLHLEESSS